MGDNSAQTDIERCTKEVKIEHLSFFFFFFAFQARAKEKLVLHLDMNYREALGWGKDGRKRHEEG